MTRKPTLLRLVETEEGTTKIYDNGFLESMINEGAYIDVPYLLDGKKIIDETIPGKKVFVLNESKGFFRISKEARKLSADAEYSKNLKAIAVVVSHEAIRLVYELFLKINKPTSLTKPFSNRRQARKWLEEQMKEFENSMIRDSIIRKSEPD